jgi:hypothetical protein
MMVINCVYIIYFKFILFLYKTITQNTKLNLQSYYEIVFIIVKANHRYEYKYNKNNGTMMMKRSL